MAPRPPDRMPPPTDRSPMSAFEIFELGDQALVATAVDAVSSQTQHHICHLAARARQWPDVEEAIPGTNNLTLLFDPLAADRTRLRETLEAACAEAAASTGEEPCATPDVVVCQGGTDGPDLNLNLDLDLKAVAHPPGMTVDVLKAGPLSSVQDLGRRGYRHLGVALAGVLDPLSFEIANRLVGNPPDAAGLEITMGPVSLRFNQASRIAITGTDFNTSLDQENVSSWWSLPVRAGQILTLRGARRGMRAYLAVAGGIDVPVVMGSRSTDLKAGFGGLRGRTLRDGDALRIGADHPADPVFAPDAPTFGVKAPAWSRFVEFDYPHQPPQYVGTRPVGPTVAVRVLRGHEYPQFTDTSQEALWTHHWTITPNSNRVGYRLSGPELEREAAHDLRVHAVLPGTIQVPPGGQPIVLLADAQTTGGYPEIGMVISADLWRLAQARLGGSLRFVECTQDEAREALRATQRYLTQVTAALEMKQQKRWS
jgi:5-oxoprolinase (ATP-hydrolysing) subunit C